MNLTNILLYRAKTCVDVLIDDIRYVDFLKFKQRNTCEIYCCWRKCMKKVGYNPKNDRIYLLTCCGKTDKVLCGERYDCHQTYDENYVAVTVTII